MNNDNRVKNTLVVGTRKGLFNISEKNGEWDISINFPGESFYAVGEERSTGRIWASSYSEWMGNRLVFSDDGGTSWEESENPLKFPEDTDTALKNIWQITSDDFGRLFCGVEPSALFISEDNGRSWSLCRGLWDHPHREQWTPGFGGLCLHTILILSEDTWVVATSTGGVYRTEDAGRSWEASNQKIEVPFLAGSEPPEFGQCVHKIAASNDEKERLFLQHHWGVYCSEDSGKTWVNIGKDKLPSDFGFPVVVNKPGSVYVIPLTSDAFRCVAENKLRVFHSSDGGDTWDSVSDGLPQENVYDCVLRDCFVAVKDLMTIGTTGGKLYISKDSGKMWETIATDLPRITCVRITNGVKI